ncbi:hypothetical protein EVAR_100439_1 [Eumeta japonica]|uniref:Uncharacterized protein n=1 Tax=Eumeta variegata TaxID=151549 RepID=A0A4C1SE45_EUMVA|nr:hypothetical protein EVAR_100439_1 [Eumeta japonica]
MWERIPQRSKRYPRPQAVIGPAAGSCCTKIVSISAACPHTKCRTTSTYGNSQNKPIWRFGYRTKWPQQRPSLSGRARQNPPLDSATSYLPPGRQRRVKSSHV